MDLFELNRQRELSKNAPLADRLRPNSLDKYIGQEHLVGHGKIIRRMIKADRIYSCIFYGPPGIGKTTLAKIISNTTNMAFEEVSAVASGIGDLKEKVQIAKDNLSYENKRTILFVDEIHRFNKSQQDYLLPFVEDSTITLIGATTENPYFEVNKALISRMYVFELKELSDDDLKKLIDLALKEDEILKNKDIRLSDNAISTLVRYSNGDSRALLNALEIAIFSEDEKDGRIDIDSATIENSINKKIAVYDKNGDRHYDTISAFIKSMRGSDIDAALYYLAKMLESGEDIKFIARRMIIFAAEDISNANPNALVLANACFEAIDKIGMPEARIILAQTVVYLAASLKSNSTYLAIDKAIDFVRNNKDSTVPNKLKDSHYAGSKNLIKDEYLYPHAFGGYVKQDYLPDDFVEEKFYEPILKGYEKEMIERLNKVKEGNNED
ncbi:replication-associated recombination protein A [Anaerococcus sp. NML200574]|uniref:replication-associated recombination protein A n=1 Tax=unclassified Anaerococcus TaxID=2614126 RepID=UPI0022383D74|nr:MULTISPECIES: replication-associated recombination protein A [unclassified Anaerococcus]MCW6678544.1 replication-associated recombination protein A [Anaerococcus sp. NML200574]MCW6701761.1 replication-associated recombination protein A [Anaerococcus sp. NML200537]